MKFELRFNEIDYPVVHPMELFKSGFKTVLGGGGEQKSTGQDATGAETV